jgi:hypothetical protein
VSEPDTPARLDRLANVAHAIIDTVAASPDPLARPCFVCGHPVRDHVPGSPCPCCGKGTRTFRAGTNLVAEAVREVKAGADIPGDTPGDTK